MEGQKGKLTRLFHLANNSLVDAVVSHSFTVSTKVNKNGYYFASFLTPSKSKRKKVTLGLIFEIQIPEILHYFTNSIAPGETRTIGIIVFNNKAN